MYFSKIYKVFLEQKKNPVVSSRDLFSYNYYTARLFPIIPATISKIPTNPGTDGI